MRFLPVFLDLASGAIALVGAAPSEHAFREIAA